MAIKTLGRTQLIFKLTYYWHCAVTFAVLIIILLLFLKTQKSYILYIQIENEMSRKTGVSCMLCSSEVDQLSITPQKCLWPDPSLCHSQMVMLWHFSKRLTHSPFKSDICN